VDWVWNHARPEAKGMVTRHGPAGWRGRTVYRPTQGAIGVVSSGVGAALVFGFGFWGVAGEEGLSGGESVEEAEEGVVCGVWV
jgi:hypothetical protein